MPENGNKGAIVDRAMEHETIISATDIDWTWEFAKYAERFWEAWQFKVMLSGIFAATCSFLGLNPALAMMAFSLLGFECILRIAAYYKRGRKRLCRGLQKGIARMIYYMVAVGISAFTQATLFHSYGLELPVTDWILGWLMLTDISAIISFLYILGFDIPKPLRRFISTTKCELTKKIEDAPAKVAKAMGNRKEDL